MKKQMFSRVIVFAIVVACTLMGCPDPNDSPNNSPTPNPPTNIPTLSTPTGVSVTAVSTGSITVSWSAVSGATGYRVYCIESAYGTYTLSGSTQSTSYTVTGLSPNKTYYIRISAYDTTRESSQSSYVYAKTAQLSIPTNISATTTSTSSITVSWSAVSGATGYRVYRSESASGTYTLAGSTQSTSYAVSGLIPNTYYFRVSAYDSAGEGSQSSYASAGIIPSTPTNLSVTIVGGGAYYQVSWSAVPGATGYHVYYDHTASGSYNGEYIGAKTTSSTSYETYGMAAYLAHYFKVSAYNSAGESALSSYVYAAAREPL